MDERSQDVKQIQPIRLAVLGARGIGKVHARIFHSLGVTIHGILASTAETALATSEDLYHTLGYKPKAFHELKTILAEPVNAVCICTPPHLHFDQIVDALDHHLPVFCEKPLFWDDRYSAEDVKSKLDTLRTHPHRRIFMNAPNALFLDTLQNRFKSSEINSVKFSFYTKGNYSGVGIGMDLFTHGLSILYRIFGVQKTSGYGYETNNSTYNCHFKYGNCDVEFDFRQDPKGQKHFSLTLNERVFTRIQEGAATTYKVYFHDSVLNDKIQVEDPFIQSAQRFIDYCKAGAPVKQDTFEASEMIMNLMAQHLILKTKS